MRRLCLSLLLLVAALSAFAQKPVYLGTLLRSADSYKCKVIAPGLKDPYDQIHMGGLTWDGGFVIGHQVGPYQPGRGVFDLKGQYTTLSFTLGQTGSYDGSAAPGGNLREQGVFQITADGKAILQENLRTDDVPKEYVLDVSGVQELVISLTEGELYLGFADARLWKGTKVPAGKPRPSATSLTLGKDVQSYHASPKAHSVGPDGAFGQVWINGRSYPCGLSFDESKSILGNSESWASYYLAEDYGTLTFVAGPRDTHTQSEGTGLLRVKADDRVLYEQAFRAADLAQTVSLPIDGCHKITFEAENIDRDIWLAVGNPVVWKAGQAAPPAPATLPGLPDACKLISSIPPYATGSAVENCLYTGPEGGRTFSMGGVRFDEGLLMRANANMIYGNSGSYAAFDLQGQFDYLTFSTGWIGVDGNQVMKDDTLRVWADDRLAAVIPLLCTEPLRHHEVPLERCRRLKLELQGMDSMFRPIFGLGDLAVYRGSPEGRPLFEHPRPECPPVTPLLDIAPPYLHYVYSMRNDMKQALKDAPGLGKGFLLQTNVHFTMDFDDSAGALIALNFIGFTPLALAAGGTAWEASIAAFNPWKEYSTLSFKATCLEPFNPGRPRATKEKMLIGADGEVVAEITLSERMQPTEYLIPIHHCEQLLFWLQCGEDTSGKYLIYDLILSR